MEENESAILTGQPCDDCGSSDALAVYSDHTYCFSCQTSRKTDGSSNLKTKGPKMKSLDLITDGKIKELRSRGISATACRKYNYTVGTFNGETVQIANYYNKNNEVVAQKIRTKDKDFKLLGSLSEALLFGQHLWKEGGKRVIITEGEIDALSVAQVLQYNTAVVSIPNGATSAEKSLRKHLEWLETFDEIIIGFDTDEPGRAATNKAVLLFTPGKAKICTWEAKDANEMLASGNVGGIITCISNAREYRPDGILSGEDIWTAMQSRETTEVFPTQYPELNTKIAKGMRRGRLYTVTAGSGIGKSTFTKEIAYHLRMVHNLRIGMVALEESAAETAYSLLGIHLDLPLLEDPDCIDNDTARQAFEEVILDHIFIHDHFGSLESTHLLSKLRYLAIGMHCDFIVLDHISIVVSGSEEADDNERRAIDKLMTNLRSLVQETGVGIILVSHLRNKNTGGKAHEDGGKIALSELRGSGGIKQLSDFVIGLERDQQGKNPNKANIRVLKARLGGKTGIAGSVTYNEFTGRLLPGDTEETPVTNNDF